MAGKIRDPERLLTELVERLRNSYGEKLVSVILYGSAATGDYTRYSDLNIVYVLTRITLAELSASEPIFRWWRELGNPAPLLLDENEFRTSTDCFPIEFHDIHERHRILHGADIVADLPIDDAFYRAEVEHELRAKLLRLRQKAAGVLSDRDLLLRLMVDSVSTFAVLARHALRLKGDAAPTHKREIIEQAAARFGLDSRPFLVLLDLREDRRKARDVHPGTLFGEYLGQIQALVDAVDRLER